MKQVWHIFIQDLRNIKRVPLAGLLLLGLAFLPSLYAWFNIKASWDPYSNTKEILVAVVNEDKGAAVEGNPINVGNELVEKLKDNEQLGWQFVSKQEAERGVVHGDYYASIYIDEQFSEDLMSVLEGEPHPSKIRYQVNEKVNAIAPKMTSAGASTIVEQISHQFISEASGALFEEFNRIGLKLEQELPTIRRAESKIYELEEAFPEINRIAAKIVTIDDNWYVFEEKVNRFLELKEAFPKINQYSEQVLLLESRFSKINEVGDYVLQLEKEIGHIEQAATQLNQVDQQFLKVEEMLRKSQEGILVAQQTIDQAQQTLPIVQEKVATADRYAKPLLEITSRLNDVTSSTIDVVIQNLLLVEDVSQSIDDVLRRIEESDRPYQLYDTLAEKNQQISTAIHVLDRAIGFLSALDQIDFAKRFEQLQPVVDFARDVRTRLIQLQGAIEKILEALQKDQQPTPEMMQQARQKSTAVRTGAGELAQQLNGKGKQQALQVTNAVQKNAEQAQQQENQQSKLTEQLRKQIRNVLDRLSEVVKTNWNMDEILQKIEKNGLKDSFYQSLQQRNEQVTTAIDTLDRALSLFEKLEKVSGGNYIQPLIQLIEKNQLKLVNLQGSLQKVLDVMERGEQPARQLIADVRTASQEVNKSAGELADFLNNGGKEQIIHAVDRAEQIAIEANQTISTVQQMLPHIEEMLQQADGIIQLASENVNYYATELPKMRVRANAIVEEIQKNIPGIIAVIEKASDFTRNDLPEIEQKVGKVAHFIREDLPKIEQEYANLAALLEEQMPIAERAIGDLAQYIRTDLPTVEKSVYSLADQIRQFKESYGLPELIELFKNDVEKEQAFFKEPVSLMEEKIFPIPNYGSANAPFYTALSLWVGALLLSNILNTEVHPKDRRDDYKMHHIYLGRMILFLIVGFLQALIVSVGNITLLGVHAAHPVLFVIFTLLIGFSFMTIVYTCASILGNIGKALAIIMMVLQLSGAGGTFPIQVAPPFFQTINPFLPFTYAINLLREAVGGVIPSFAWKQIGMLLLFWGCAVIVGLVLKKPLAPRVLLTNQKSKSSRLMD